MYQLRVMWESSLKFCQDIAGENVVARNMLQNSVKLSNNKFSVSQLQCSTICIPVALAYTDQVSCWAIPVDASQHAFCTVPLHDYTRGLRAEGAQYIAVFVITQGINSSINLELIPTHTYNRSLDNMAQCGSIWLNVRESEIPSLVARPVRTVRSERGSRISSLAYRYINCNNWSLIPIYFVLKQERWNWKRWLTAATSCIMMPEAPSISKYMWLVSDCLFKLLIFLIPRHFIKVTYQ
jgi:hypothetical protein